jgi:hypothetical protein
MIYFKAQYMYRCVKTKENNDKLLLIQQAYRARFKLQSVPNMKWGFRGEEAHKKRHRKDGKESEKEKKDEDMGRWGIIMTESGYA